LRERAVPVGEQIKGILAAVPWVYVEDIDARFNAWRAADVRQRELTPEEFNSSRVARRFLVVVRKARVFAWGRTFTAFATLAPAADDTEEGVNGPAFRGTDARGIKKRTHATFLIRLSSCHPPPICGAYCSRAP